MGNVEESGQVKHNPEYIQFIIHLDFGSGRSDRLGRSGNQVGRVVQEA